MRRLEQISNLINYLSNEEDIRQDLWVSYLSGTPVESLESRLVEIKKEYSEDIELQKSIWSIMKNPPSEHFLAAIKDNFTEYEKSIICYIMLGFDSNKIADIKGISQVRIKQSIATIRYNNFWKEVYGIKEKPDRRREIRS